MPKSYLSFLMLLFAAVLILVLYDSYHKPKKHINASKVYSDEIFGHTGAEAYETMAKKSNTIIERDGNLIAEDTGYVQIDTLLPAEKNITGWAIVLFDTLGNVTICYQPSASSVGDSSISYLDERNLKIRLVAGRWEVESALPVQISLKNDCLESNKAFQKAEQTLIKYYRFRGFKVETEWSHTVQCSVLVKWSKAEGDSIIVYESPNPDSYPKQKNND